MTSTETRTPTPTTRAFGYAEIIRAHRLYIGLSQRDMATLLRFDRRDYQRIESGQNACPVGFLTRLEELSDQFHHDVERVLDAAEDPTNWINGALLLAVSASGKPEDEWERLVAGRAAVEASADAPITLTVSGN